MMKHRDKMNVLESPKSDETELVPISSNKINIQGRNFTKKKLVIFGIFLWSPKKRFSKKSKQRLSLPGAIFLKWFLMKSLWLIYLIIFAYVTAGIIDRSNRNLILFSLTCLNYKSTRVWLGWEQIWNYVGDQLKLRTRVFLRQNYDASSLIYDHMFHYLMEG